MLKKFINKNEIVMMSPQKLAFLGDSVYEIIVREKIICSHNADIGALNSLKVKSVCCEYQAELFEKIKDMLTEEELDIYKRGRNVHVKKIPKKSSPITYHKATGLEALFGFLYLSGQEERLRELSNKIDL